MCSNCQRKVEQGALIQGCMECVYFACNKCAVKLSRRGGGRFPPRNTAEELLLEPGDRAKAIALRDRTRRCDLLRGCGRGGKIFDFSRVLDFGFIDMTKLNAEIVRRFVQRGKDAELRPLPDAYDYYVRGVILHSEAQELLKEKAPPPGAPANAAGQSPAVVLKRDKLLHEARESLLEALQGSATESNKMGWQQFHFAKAQNHKSAEVDPRSPTELAADDPRVWFALGQILVDLEAHSEARQIYRQALSRLPRACFALPMHFNLACYHACQPGEASEHAAMRELKEFRRLCRERRGLCHNTGPPDRPGASSPKANSTSPSEVVCDICGGPRMSSVI